MMRSPLCAVLVHSFLLTVSAGCSSAERERGKAASEPPSPGACAHDEISATGRLDTDGDTLGATGGLAFESNEVAVSYPWLADTSSHQSLADRFPPPEGYRRVEVEEGSFAEWLRFLPMRPPGTTVRAYDGRIVLYADSPGLAGVVGLDTGRKNLQQCADAIIRLRAEYLWSRGDARSIAFHFTSGDLSRWEHWADGTRPVVQGREVEWRKTATRDRSRGNFGRYLENLFVYAGTISLARDSVPVSPERMQIGDFFLKSGSPGHAVIVLDMAVGPQGRKKAILGQGFMPAQDFHVLRSDRGTPWFDLDFAGVGVKTPFWKTFPWSSLRRLRGAGGHPRSFKVVHVFVALCDNKHQSIVPVPAELGDGKDPRTNLYWGAMYGVKTFLRRSPHWREHVCARPEARPAVLDRCLFELSDANPGVWVLADAYDGAKMKDALRDFFDAAAGRSTPVLDVTRTGKKVHIAAGGRADLVCFVGHNGLMDVHLGGYPVRRSQKSPASAVVLACKSHAYFKQPLRRAGSEPLLTATGLMAPEAYTLDAAVRSWAANDPPEATRFKAAKAYAKYQRISERAALRLFVTGWGD